MNDDDYLDAQHDFQRLLENRSNCFEVTEPLRAHFDGTNRQFRKLVERTRVQSGYSNDLYAGLVPDSSLNGFATRRYGKYLIGINFGVEALLSIAVSRILADRYTLLGFGNPLAEAEDLPPLNILVNNLELHDLKSGPIRPRDPTRREIASLVTQFATSFILHHEYAHIAFGHVDLLRSRYSHFTEFPEFARPDYGMTDLESQSMEIHADRMAIFALLDIAQRSHEIRHKGPVELQRHLEDPLIALSLATFAIQLVFQIFFGQHSIKSFTETGSHPHPAVRLAAFLGALFVHFTHRAPQYANDFSDFIKTTLNGVDMSIARVVANSLDTPQLAALRNPRVSEQHRRLVESLDAMKDDLAPFEWRRHPSQPMFVQDTGTPNAVHRDVNLDLINYYDPEFMQEFGASP
jgi:hypothetical protein